MRPEGINVSKLIVDEIWGDGGGEVIERSRIPYRFRWERNSPRMSWTTHEDAEQQGQAVRNFWYP
jgi:hypothetical protein